MLARRFLLVLFFLAFAGPATAHEVRPGYLQIHEIEPAVYDFIWKTPARGDMRLALNVILPAECRTLGAARITPSDGAVIERWRGACDGGLPGKEIAIENLAASLTDVIVRFEPLSGAPKTLRLTGAEPHREIPAETQSHSGAGAYFPLGVEHILVGVDHLLFVLCLLI